MMQRAYRLVGGVMVTSLLVAAGGMLLLRWGGLELLSVRSGSMSPVLQPGDAVLIRHQPAHLRIGDVISFHSREHKGAIMTHRIISISDRTGAIVTQGDAAFTADLPIPPQTVIGSVEHVVPYGGRVLEAFRHPVGLAIAVYLPAVCIIGAEVQRLGQHYASVPRCHYLLRGHHA